MTLPTVTRNWCFTSNGVSSLNQSFFAPASYSDDAAKGYALYQFKKTLVGFAQGPWTVIQSRNGLGNWGNADHWTSAAAVATYSFTSNPWIVLQNNFAGRTTQILLNPKNASNGYTGHAWISTTTLFPASVGGAFPVVPSDAIRWNGDQYDNDSWFFGGTQGYQKMHVMQAWDVATSSVLGLRVACFQAGSCVGWAFLERLVNMPTGGTAWTYPDVCTWGGNTTSYPPSWWVISQTTNSYRLRAISGTTRVMPVGITECNRGTPISMLDSGRPHVLSGGYAMTPLKVAGFEAPFYGHMGDFVDFWIGTSSSPSGIYYPPGSPATPTLAQFGHFVWPWDPTAGAPQTT